MDAPARGMFDSKFGVSFPPHSDNLLWKFTPLSYCYHRNVILLYSIYIVYQVVVVHIYYYDYNPV